MLSKKSSVKKILTYFKTTHDLKPPYSCLVLPDFMIASLGPHINLKTDLPKITKSRAYPLITPCSVRITKLKIDNDPELGSPTERIQFLSYLEKLERTECTPSLSQIPNHDPYQCNKRLIQLQPVKYMVATQAKNLEAFCKKMGSVPTWHITHGSLMLAQPMKSLANSLQYEKNQQNATLSTASENKLLKLERKQQFLLESQSSTQSKRNKRMHIENIKKRNIKKVKRRKQHYKEQLLLRQQQEKELIQQKLALRLETKRRLRLLPDGGQDNPAPPAKRVRRRTRAQRTLSRLRKQDD